jgi:hypothetical protein
MLQLTGKRAQKAKDPDQLPLYIKYYARINRARLQSGAADTAGKANLTVGEQQPGRTRFFLKIVYLTESKGWGEFFNPGGVYQGAFFILCT